MFQISPGAKCSKENYSGGIKSIIFFGDFPLDYAQIAAQTKSDQFLQQVTSYIRDGWPKKIDNRWKPTYSLRFDMEVTEDCILYQDRVFIPASLQNAILKLLHANHNGIVKMKQIARRCLFWFGMNGDIENFVKHCQICMQTSVVPKTGCNSSWTPTTRPFSRIHADFFFLESRTYLIIVDSYTKWLEIEIMKNGTDANKVIKKFTVIFARFGLPDVLVTDGGPPFNSSQFCSFMERQGIKVMKSPPYNPSSNGQAERMVKVAKEVLKKFMLDPETRSLDIEDRLTLFLANYRNTCSIDDKFPSEKMFSFKPKMLIDLLHPKSHYKNHLESIPNIKRDNLHIDNKDVPYEDPFSKLVLGNKILYKNHDKHAVEKWIEAQYVKRVSLNIFEIFFGRHTLKAHRNQLRIVPAQPTCTTIRIPIQRMKRPRSVSDSEEEFYGFPDVPAVPTDSEGVSRRLKHIRRSPIITRSSTRTKRNYHSTASNQETSQQR